MNEGNEYQASGRGWVQMHCVAFLMEQISHKRSFWLGLPDAMPMFFYDTSQTLKGETKLGIYLY